MTTTPALGAASRAIVYALQHATQINYDLGVDKVDIDGNVLAPLSLIREGETQPMVTRTCDAEVPGSCSLTIEEDLVWGRDLIAPYRLVSSPEVNNGEWYRFPRGLYVATSPRRALREGHIVHDLVGYDKNYLLQADVGNTFVAANASTFTSNIATLLSMAGFPSALSAGELNSAYISFPGDLTSKTITLGDQVFPCDDSNQFTYIGIINQLLKACGCRPIYTDPLGRFTIEYLVDAKNQPQLWVFSGSATSFEPDFAYTGGSTSPTDKTLIEDVWNVPNRWIFIQQGLTFEPTEGSGKYTVNNAPGQTYYQAPSDQNTIGRIIPKIIRLNANDQTDLTKQGNDLVVAQLSSASQLDLTTAPWPCAWHYDVFQYADAKLPRTNVRKVQALSWREPLDGTEMTWTTRVVAEQ